MEIAPQVFRVRQSFQGPEIRDVGHAVRRAQQPWTWGRQFNRGSRLQSPPEAEAYIRLMPSSEPLSSSCGVCVPSPSSYRRWGVTAARTAAGQVEVLASLGVTEVSVGCPIRASMDTVVVCEAAEGFPVHFDRLAFEADHVLVCNRVKPHTGFTGDLQSGLMKMMLIGLGKKAGAEIYHRACQDHGFGPIVRSVAGEVLKRCHIAAALGVVENGYEQTALIQAARPADIEARKRTAQASHCVDASLAV